MRIGLSIGHGAKLIDGRRIKDPGAAHPSLGISEFDTCRRIFNVLYPLLAEHWPTELVVAPIEATLQEKVESLNLSHNNHGPIDLSIELHLNGAEDKKATGTECLFYPNSDRGYLWARKLQEVLIDILGFRNRGIKEREDLYFLTATVMPAVILEPWFITGDDAKDAVGGDLVQRTAWAIFRGLIE